MTAVSPPPPPPSEGDHHAAALAQLDRLQALFGRVEGKASFLFGVNLALLASVAVATPFKLLWSPGGAFGLIAAGLLAFSMTNLYAAFYPHLANPRASTLYFADIARMTAADYMGHVRSASIADKADDALCQVWRNAQILDKKFKRSRSAFILTGAAIPFWLALLVVVVQKSGVMPGAS